MKTIFPWFCMNMYYYIASSKLKTRFSSWSEREKGNKMLKERPRNEGYAKCLILFPFPQNPPFNFNFLTPDRSR